MALSRRSSRLGRSRFTLLLLVLTSITVLTLDFRGAGVVDDLRGAATTVFSPLADVAGAVTEPFTDAWNGAFGYGDLERENERLRDQIADMEGDAARATDANRQLAELAELQGITNYTALPSVTARVVGSGLTNFEHDIQIDRGSDHGIAVGMPVVTGAGLVGRVTTVTGDRSTVQLINDPAFDLGVRLATSGEVGIGHGTGEGRPLTIDAGIEVSLQDSIPEREVVTTSGLGRSAFPPDIPVGRVIAVEEAADQLGLVLTVEPGADLADLAYVRVLQWEPTE
jgi:rod shape-determining protein MreC